MRARSALATWRVREAPQLPSPGEVLDGKYRIDAEIARGGMAAIFAAEHLVLGQRVAIKVMLAEVARAQVSVERLLLEARATARLQSAHTARVLDAGVLSTGLPFLVMEYLDGTDLAALLARGGPLPPAQVADLALQALCGLAHAHAAGIVHRDLKPSNLFLATTADGTSVLKVLDFGVSMSCLDPSRDTHGADDIVGSPSYMSPEHVRSARSVDARSDLWALGVTVYELLTGVGPFDTTSLGETFAAILSRTPPSPRSLRADVPEGLSRVVVGCLRSAREDRYADAGHLARAIAPFGTGRWSHLVEDIEATLARKTPPGPMTTWRPTLIKLTHVGLPIDALAPTVPPPDAVMPGPRDSRVKLRSRSGRLAAGVCGAALLGLVFAGSYGAGVRERSGVARAMEDRPFRVTLPRASSLAMKLPSR